MFGEGDRDGSDDWDLWIDSDIGFVQVAFDSDANPFDFDVVVVTRFRVGADGLDDDFRVKGLTAMAAVPVACSLVSCWSVLWAACPPCAAARLRLPERGCCTDCKNGALRGYVWLCGSITRPQS